MSIYVGGGEARNKLIKEFSKKKPEYFTTLDRDYVVISDNYQDIPEDIMDDVQLSSSIESYFESRDISINECLYSKENDKLIASEQAIKDCNANIIRQKEEGARAALRALRFAAILGWRVKLDKSLKSYYLEDEEFFEYQTTIQFLRAAQSAADKKFIRLLKSNGVNTEDFIYHPDLIPDWSTEPVNDIEDTFKTNFSIIEKVPEKYIHLVSNKNILIEHYIKSTGNL